MLHNLTTEACNPASERLDELSALEIVHLMAAEDARVPAAVAEQAEAIAAAIETIAVRLQQGGRLIYFGAGTSGRLGVLDATECPPTFNSPPEQVIGLIAGGPGALTRAVEGAEDKPDLAVADLQAVQLSAADAVVGIATSGRTPYVIGGLRHAREVGAFAIAVSCNTGSEVSAVADLTIAPIVGPEILSGSTRLKAGTATKLVLNMLSTGAMVRIGKTFGNLMVDLRATNTKLRDRTQRIVSQLTGLSPADAGDLLARCDGELKTAVVAHHRGAAAVESRQLLAAAGGQLRQAIDLSSPHAPREVSGIAAKPRTNKVIDSPADLTRSVRDTTNLVLGIDGGGTGTVALLGTVKNGELHILARGVAGPSNPSSLGFAAALAALDSAIADAFQAAQLPFRRVEAACLALAGAGRERERRILEQWASSHDVAAKFEQVHDAEPVLAAGTPEGWGIALISGTGSLAYGMNRNGQTARCGGWGYLFGDEGSAYALALAGLRAVAQAVDGRGPPTLLQVAMLRALQVNQPSDLVAAIYGASLDRTSIASLAAVVTQIADEDAVARALVNQSADELARMVHAVAAQIGFSGEPIPLALAGGVLLGSSSVRNRLEAALHRTGTTASPTATVAEPAEGALRIAARIVGSARS